LGTVNANGTYSYDIICEDDTDPLLFYVSVASQFTIDSVSIKRYYFVLKHYNGSFSEKPLKIYRNGVFQDCLVKRYSGVEWVID
jgi:hypothetical protein